MPQLDQRQGAWPAEDTGSRAYVRVANDRRNAPEAPKPQQSPFAEIDKRASESVEKYKLALDNIKKLFVLRDEKAVTLKVLTEEDGSSEIYVVAEWTGPAREAMTALDSFIDRCWIGKSGPSAGRVSVTYELT